MLLAAGGIPHPNDPLYEYTQGGYKSLVEVAGKPMVQWALDAISESKHIERVVLAGLDESSGLSCQKALNYLPDQGEMIANIRTGALRVLEMDNTAEYVLMVFSDIPLINAEMLDWVVENSGEGNCEVYMSMIPRQDMDARFPGIKRRFTRFNDSELRTGNINVVSVDKILERNGLGDRIAEARHNRLKQITLVGLETLLYLALGRMNLERFVQHITKKLGVTWQPLICPYPEIAMDVDEPSHLELVRIELSKRNGS